MPRRPAKATDEEKRDWEVEKLRNEVRSLGRTFIFAVVTAVLALATTAYQIYDKVSSFERQQYEKKKLEDKIEELATQREVATSNFNQYQSDLEDLKSNSSLTPQQKLDQLKQLSPSFQLSAPDSVTGTDLPARIYLQYLESQETRIDSYVKRLEDANYKVKRIPNSPSGRRRGASVAYYYAEDQDGAGKLIDLLKTMGIPAVDQTPVKLNGAARRRHFDVWIALPE